MQTGFRCASFGTVFPTPNEGVFISGWWCQDAEGLWEKSKEKQGSNKWRPEVEEEYEDTEGNEFDGKTITELQRQGLI